MELNYKNIIIKNEKRCKICGKSRINDDIIIMKNSICKNCVQDIVSIEANDARYETIKEKVKLIWKSRKF